MKRKIIGFAVACLLVAVLSMLFMPAMSPDVDVGATGAVISAETADLAGVSLPTQAVNSEVSLTISESTLAPASMAGEITLLLVLGVAFFIIAVVCQSRFTSIVSGGLRGTGLTSGGGSNKFI